MRGLHGDLIEVLRFKIEQFIKKFVFFTKGKKVR